MPLLRGKEEEGTVGPAQCVEEGIEPRCELLLNTEQASSYNASAKNRSIGSLRKPKRTPSLMLLPWPVLGVGEPGRGLGGG